MKQRSGGSQYLISVFLVLFAAVINYGISLVLTPYITESLGTEAYGFVSLARTFANYTTVVTVAVNAVATRYITVEYHKNNISRANTYYSTLFFADVIMSGAILAGAIVIIGNLDKVLHINPSMVGDVKKLFLLAVINTCIISIGTIFNSATLIKNRLDIASAFKILAYVVEAGVLFALFSQLQPHVQYVGLGMVMSSLVLIGTNYYYENRTIKELRIKRKAFTLSALKEVFVTGIWYSFNSLGNMLNSGLDLWISNLLLSSLQMGQLAIVKTVTTIATALYQLTAQPFQPILIRYYAENNMEKLKSSLKLALKTNGCLSNILFAFLVVFGLNYYRLWTPLEDINLLTSITLISIIGTVIEGTVTPLYYVYVLTLKNKIPCIITLVSGFLNVVSMYILIKHFHFGLEVVVGTTAVLSWITNFVFTPIYTARCLSFKCSVFYTTILRNLISSIILIGAFKVTGLIINPTSWGMLILTSLLCLIIGGLLHLIIVIDNEERQIVRTITERIIRKNKNSGRSM